MNSKIIGIGLMLVSIVAMVAWYRADSSLKEERMQYRVGELQPISRLLADNQALINELQGMPDLAKDAGILQSYITRIRKDGVPKNADLKQRLDQLAENDTAIVTLIKVYAPHAKTAAFVSEGDKFRNYASAWRDRWNSIMELYMAGGNFAVTEIPFPSAFPTAVQTELIAIK